MVLLRGLEEFVVAFIDLADVGGEENDNASTECGGDCVWNVRCGCNGERPLACVLRMTVDSTGARKKALDIFIKPLEMIDFDLVTESV